MVDLGGYIIILTNDDGKIKLYGSPADSADSLEVGDEILEVNGRTLENATHSEVIQHIHQCIKSRTICLRVRRRSGNKIEELDGPNAGRIQDAWVIAVESGARERLQKLTAHQRIQPRDIQTILHQQISEQVASTSEDIGGGKDVTNNQITVTVGDKELASNAYNKKLSNGTIPKGISKENELREARAKERKELLEKQQSCPDEANLLLQPVQSGWAGERRSSSPFQNGRTEVLIWPEGGPRSPRGSTSSTANDLNFLNSPKELDHIEPIYRPRRRGSGVTDIHPQQQQQQQQQQQLGLGENNNSSSREGKKVQEVVGPDEMWAPEALGHHRELPVDVPDTLLQKAYPNKVTNRSSSERQNELRHSRSASDFDLSSLNLRNETPKVSGELTRPVPPGRLTDTTNIRNGRQLPVLSADLERSESSGGTRKQEVSFFDTISSVKQAHYGDEIKENKVLGTHLETFKGKRPVEKVEGSKTSSAKAADGPFGGNPDEVDRSIEGLVPRREPSFDVEDDYPFAKEDYPTMLKTCSDDSTSPRSSSGRSDSTAPLDSTLLLRPASARKDSPAYETRRIDLGSPCRSMVSDIKITPFFASGRDATFFDNPAYVLTDLQDLQGLILRSGEQADLDKFIDEQKSKVVLEEQRQSFGKATADKSGRSSKQKRDPKLAKLKAKSKSLEAEELIAIGSMDNLDNLLNDPEREPDRERLTSSSRQRKKKKPPQQFSSGYSTLRSEISTGDLELTDRSFLLVSGKPYREVAVDCPADFVPVTKCHPVYPPPTRAKPRTETKLPNPEGIGSKAPSASGSESKMESAPCKQREREKKEDDEENGGNGKARDGSVKSAGFTAGSSAKDADRVGRTLESPSKALRGVQSDRSSLAVFPGDSPVKVLLADVDAKVSEGGSKLLPGDDKDSMTNVVARTEPKPEGQKNNLHELSPPYMPMENFLLPKRTHPSSSETSFLGEDWDFPRPSKSHDELPAGSSGEIPTKYPHMGPFWKSSSFRKNQVPISRENQDPTPAPPPYHPPPPPPPPRGRSKLSSSTHEQFLAVTNEELPPLGRPPKADQPRLRDSSCPSSSSFAQCPRDDADPAVILNESSGNDDAAESCCSNRDPKSKLGKQSSFSWETNQNWSNSFREYSYRQRNDFLGKDDVTGDSDVSPQIQNQSNKRLLLKYKCLDVSKISSLNHVDHFDPVGKSTLVPQGHIRSYSSDPELFSRSSSSPETFQPQNASTCMVTALTPPPNESIAQKSAISPTLKNGHEPPYPCEDLDNGSHQIGLNGVKPAIPPRDQKRAPARPPKDNIRLSSQNNNLEQDAPSLEPTQQQLHSIKKYQEQLRKRKDEEERQEILNRSLRDSRKLHALQSNSRSCPIGVENPAYAQDEVTPGVSSVVQVSVNHAVKEVEEPPKALTFGEVVATLERLQLQLRNLSGSLGISGQSVEAELKAVQTLLVQSQFASALTTHHLLRDRLRSGKVLKHHADDASSLARDVVDTLEKWQSSATTTCASTAETIAAVEELTSILTSYDVEALLLAHDLVATYVDGLQRKHSTSSSSPSVPPSPSSTWVGSRLIDNIKIIRIEKTNEPLGATVRNEGDAVIIGRVVRGGAADKSGLLHEGDEVLEVNGQEMRGKSVNEVCDILAGMQGSLTFLVLPAPTSHRNNMQNRRDDTFQIQHIRAHFDYDPEEDPYIPCRELGVRFEKGDVLHVISQEDPNWWQAYKEGEEDQTLAGLIPSKAFQHQRESTKQTIAGDNSTVRGSKKSSTLLCARKNPKKKKRSKFGSNFTDDSYPIYATPTIDDYDNDEVLTYEEVALYYPRADHKRPIVLIGPPNIGRHELRQKLMQNSERFAAAIPHTSRPRKENEIDGQDYHFISRAQFEADILCRKFVEHGEYEKAYYGTSIEAIRAVVDARKICVLNLHPQSLKILRNSDLKPYVVFVGPPSLEKLKQKRIKNNESFKEEELKDIIEKAREMDDKYGHLFDMIIINNDTDWAYNQLLTEINSLEREPQWVPAHWVD